MESLWAGQTGSAGGPWNTLLDFTISWRARNRNGVVLVVDDYGLGCWAEPYATSIVYDGTTNKNKLLAKALHTLAMTVKSGLLQSAVVVTVGPATSEDERLARESVRYLGGARLERHISAIAPAGRVADLIVVVTSETTATIRKNRGGAAGVEISFGPEALSTCTPPQP